MFGANEPNARPTAHDKQPKMVVTRTPNLFRIALETGPRKQILQYLSCVTTYDGHQIANSWQAAFVGSSVLLLLPFGQHQSCQADPGLAVEQHRYR